MWSLKERGKDLEPKSFSNGKTQEGVVNEVLAAIRQGKKVIFIHGVCGSGKSAIALNIAKELGKASIVVPIKNLQRQYERDYMKTKEVFKNDGSKLGISMITGRNNHKCCYLEQNDNKSEIKQGIKKREFDGQLGDVLKIIEDKQKKMASVKNPSDDTSADNSYIPCKIEIKEKNMDVIRKYYRENPDKKNLVNLNVKQLKRMSVAPACPYWSPILLSDLKVGIESEEKKYSAVGGDFSIHVRKSGCPYYEQFLSYVNSDAVIFNSAQYLLETFLGRKPATEVEIIDECDEFLDNLAAEGVVNLNRLRTEAGFLLVNEEEQEKIIEALKKESMEVYNHAKLNYLSEKVFSIKETPVYELIRTLRMNNYREIVQDEDSYIDKMVDLSMRFYDLLEDTYVQYYKVKDREEYGVKLVTINLDKMFNSLLEKNKVFVLMSGTLHNGRVLKEIFGINNYHVVEAEVMNQGTVSRVYTGLEMDCKYENFKNGVVTREKYLKALDKCVSLSKKPTVVHVNAFADLPSEKERYMYDLDNLISSEQLIEQQNKDKTLKLVQDFKDGKSNLLFTTRCNRGVDFPFGVCNSVVITKFPYPNTKSLFWDILKRNKPMFFWDFYKDKAHRELLQKIYRSVRAKNDHVNLLSPDIRVMRSSVV